MTVEEAEKEFIEALDKSMGNLYARGDWYKRKTVRMAFRKGWQRAMEQVNNCDAPAVVGRSEQLVSFLRQYQKSCEIMHVSKIDAKNFVEQYKTN